jgi:RimJ/RimL family protein N-acetyltransferase
MRSEIREVELTDGELRLRPPRREEAELYARWWADPEVSYGFCSGGRTAAEIDQAFPELEAEAADIGHWIEFVLEVAGRPIGYLWLSRWDLEAGTCELNIMVGEREFRGRHYGRRAVRLLCGWAFHTMKLARIRLCPRSDHYPAMRAYRAAGARLGDLRDEVVYWENEAVLFRELYFLAEDFGCAPDANGAGDTGECSSATE